MSDSLTPEELNAENALICEKLLGWKQSSIKGYWYPNDEHAGSVTTPTFHSWYHAGLILEAFATRDVAFDLYQDGEWSIGFYGKHTKCHTRASKTGPLAVRSAALAYIRSLP